MIILCYSCSAQYFIEYNEQQNVEGSKGGTDCDEKETENLGMFRAQKKRGNRKHQSNCRNEEMDRKHYRGRHCQEGHENLENHGGMDHWQEHCSDSSVGSPLIKAFHWGLRNGKVSASPATPHRETDANVLNEQHNKQSQYGNRNDLQLSCHHTH